MNLTINTKVKITVNGVEYDSVDQLPPDVRALYEKALRHATVTSTKSITINGQSISSLADVPPEVRTLTDDALRAVARRAMPGWTVVLLLGLLAVIVFYLFRAR